MSFNPRSKFLSLRPTLHQILNDIWLQFNVFTETKEVLLLPYF